MATTTAHPIRAGEFTASIGVNTHLPYTDGDYANYGAVVSDLNYLGINHIRDSIPNPATPGFGSLSYDPVANAGIKFDFLAGTGDTDLTNTLGRLDDFAKAHPGAISSVEGPNEVNNWPITFNGQTGDAGALAFQAALYDAVKADPLLQGVPVINLTSYPNLVGKADFYNEHPYPGDGDQPLASLNQVLQHQQTLMPGKAPVLSEVGYYTLPNGGGWGGVDEATQAKLTLNLVLDAAKIGAERTFLYQLLDAYDDPNSSDIEKHFGLFDANNQPKPAATAIHNFTSILQDTGSLAQSFSPQDLTYSLSGLPDTGSSLLLQKSSGAYDLVVWNEPDIWDQAGDKPIAAGSRTVTADLGATFGSVKVFDPLVGTNPVQTLTNAHQVEIAVSDHPLIVELSSPNGNPTPPTTGGPVPPSGGAAGSLVLQLSGDHYVGDPQFQVFVDGQQVGSTQSVQAVHANGQWQDVTIPGTFDPGKPHLVDVRFVNDAWDGQQGEGHDRNLYVGNVTLDGHAFGYSKADPAAMLGNGSTAVRTEGIAGATPPDSGVPGPGIPNTDTGSLKIQLSGDHYAGDPQFQVFVDGQQVGGAQSVQAVHALGQWQDVTIPGNFDPGKPHLIDVRFINDAWDGQQGEGHDRNLYVGSVTLDGDAFGYSKADPATMLGNGSIAIRTDPAAAPQQPTGGSGGATDPSAATGSIVLQLSGDHYAGDPQFQILVDGQQAGGTQSVQAVHANGQWQDITLSGEFDLSAPHLIEVRFVNDAWDGHQGEGHDRNLYVGSATFGGDTFGYSKAEPAVMLGNSDVIIGTHLEEWQQHS